MNTNKLISYLLSASIFIVLTSCGGGGGGGSGSGGSENIAISSNIPAEAESLSLITLDASATTVSDNSSLKYNWRLNNHNSEAMIFNGQSAVARLRVPNVSSESNLEVELSVEGASGGRVSELYTITVTPYSVDEIMLNTRTVSIDLSRSNLPNIVTSGVNISNPQTEITSTIDSVSLNDDILEIDIASDKLLHLFLLSNEDTGVTLPALKLINDERNDITFTGLDIILGYVYQMPSIKTIDEAELYDYLYNFLSTKRLRDDLYVYGTALENMFAEGYFSYFDYQGAFEKYQSIYIDFDVNNNGVNPDTGRPIGEDVISDLQAIESNLWLEVYDPNSILPDKELTRMAMSLYFRIFYISGSIMENLKPAETAQRGSAYAQNSQNGNSGIYLRQYDDDGAYEFRVLNHFNSIYSLEVDEQYVGLIGAMDGEWVWESDPKSYAFNDGDNDYSVRFLNGLDGTISNMANTQALQANALYITCKMLDMLAWCPLQAGTIAKVVDVVSNDPFFHDLIADVSTPESLLNRSKSLLEGGIKKIIKIRKNPDKARKLFQKMGLSDLVEKLLVKGAKEKVLLKILEKRVNPALQLYDYYKFLQFEYELLSAEHRVDICAIVEKNGTLLTDDAQLSEATDSEITCKINHPPEPTIAITYVNPGSASHVSGNIYKVSPGAGMIVDATGSTDDRTPVDELVYEWSDGINTQPYSSDPTFGTAANKTGDITVTLRVKDSQSAIGTASIILRAADSPFNITSPSENAQLLFDQRHTVTVNAVIQNFHALYIYVNDQEIAHYSTENEGGVYTTFFSPIDIVNLNPGSTAIVKAVGVNEGGTTFEDSVVVAIAEQEQPPQPAVPIQVGDILFNEEIQRFESTIQPPFDPNNPSITYSLVSDLYQYVLTPSTNQYDASSGFPMLTVVGELGSGIARQGYNSNSEIVDSWSDGARRLTINLEVTNPESLNVISMPEDGVIPGGVTLSLITREAFTGPGNYTLLTQSDGITGYSDPNLTLDPVTSSYIITRGCDIRDGQLSGQIDVTDLQYLSGTDLNSNFYHYAVDFDLTINCTVDHNHIGGPLTHTTRIEGSISGLEGIGVENPIPIF